MNANFHRGLGDNHSLGMGHHVPVGSRAHCPMQSPLRGHQVHIPVHTDCHLPSRPHFHDVSLASARLANTISKITIDSGLDATPYSTSRSAGPISGIVMGSVLLVSGIALLIIGGLTLNPVLLAFGALLVLGGAISLGIGIAFHVREDTKVAEKEEEKKKDEVSALPNSNIAPQLSIPLSSKNEKAEDKKVTNNEKNQKIDGSNAEEPRVVEIEEEEEIEELKDEKALEDELNKKKEILLTALAQVETLQCTPCDPANLPAVTAAINAVKAEMVKFKKEVKSLSEEERQNPKFLEFYEPVKDAAQRAAVWPE